MSDQPICRLTRQGLEEFWKYIDQSLVDRKAGQPIQSLPPGLVLSGSPFTEELQLNVTLDLAKVFNNRFELGEYLCKRFGSALNEELLNDDVGLWAWIAAAYFDQFTAKGVNRQEHYIPLIGAYAKRLGHQRLDYRHCARTPVMLVRLLGQSAKFFLCGTARRPRGMSEMGDLIEQVLSRQDVFGNERIRSVILELYQDENGLERVGSTGIPKKKKLKNGKWSQSGKGGIRRLIEGVLPRLKITYDVYDLPPQEIIALAGPEFNL